MLPRVLANQRSQRQTLGLQGGSSTQTFTYKADEYEENRHFLMAQYFRNNYNKAMKNLPVVNSLVQILRVEVWVTNRTGATTETRDVVALMDLGEGQPYRSMGWHWTMCLREMMQIHFIQQLLIHPSSTKFISVTSVLTGIGFAACAGF